MLSNIVLFANPPGTRDLLGRNGRRPAPCADDCRDAPAAAPSAERGAVG
ncbi:hypothetical protein I545_4346 [Mycobacterium kansasii 662]|uniref:Uncharacterized protein n=1 Tax=Mycobacterium kansasii 662 TaxID=1299326 RepID=X7ZD06_MYCKA|nr:hypothetical protein I545_4346 [Mycobacterium kansasii 662]KEP40882.1 hypothetical protein MKSMC1_40080 [Mycobacterium kansasii]